MLKLYLVGVFVNILLILSLFEKTISYIESDYNITQGSILDGLLIEKVEIYNGEIILYSTYTSKNIKMNRNY